MRTISFVALIAAAGCASKSTATATGTPEAADAASTGAPEVGDRVQMFDLPSHDGERVALADALAQGPVVLVFYRGHW